MGKRASIRVREIVAAGVIAAGVIACGEAMMDGSGGVMEDAGELMTDAGDLLSDAGRQMIDAGRDMMEMGGEMLVDAGQGLNDAGDAVRDAGDAMRDAGDAMRDASSGMMPDSTSAQTACGTCTAGDRQMVVTADQDVQQLRGGTVEDTGWTQRTATTFTPTSPSGMACPTYESRLYTAELADGPLVLTDVYSTSGTSVLYTVSSSSECVESYAVSTPFASTCGSDFGQAAMHDRLRQSTSARTLFQAPSSLSGARIVIRSGETLCALTGNAAPVATTQASGVGTRLLWAGFAPYE